MNNTQTAHQRATQWTETYFKNRNEVPTQNRYRQIYDQVLATYLLIASLEAELPDDYSEGESVP